MNAKATAVLLVEDSPSDAALFREMLEDSTNSVFDVTSVTTLKEATARLCAEPIDVILLDLSLPDSAGLETVTKMSRRTFDVPIIVLTGQENEAVAIQTLQQGAQDYLVKNEVDRQLLERSIRYAIERKRLEEELRQTLKLEALGHLAAGVAHDFNNILTVIQGYSDILLSDIEKADSKFDMVYAMSDAAHRGAALVRQLMAFGRKQTPKPKEIGLGDAIKALEKMLRRLVGENIQIVTDVESDLGKVRIDPTQLDQILINLVVNARDAMPGGGVLTIQTTNVDVDDSVVKENSEAWPASYVMLKISDTGHGIGPEDLPHIFQPFYTTKEEGQGTGLGLSTVYGIVRQSGGEIRVESDLAVGTAFTIVFPEAEHDTVATIEKTTSYRLRRPSRETRENRTRFLNSRRRSGHADLQEAVI